MKIFSFTLVVLFAFVLTSCNKIPDQNPINIEVAKYVITNINPPKHFCVDFIRVADGRQFTNVYISKHCKDWGLNSIGDTITLNRYTYTDGERDVIEFNNSEIHDCLCQ